LSRFEWKLDAGFDRKAGRRGCAQQFLQGRRGKEKEKRQLCNALLSACCSLMFYTSYDHPHNHTVGAISHMCEWS
jgi:hypothetical protein